MIRIEYYRNYHILKYAHKCYNVRIPSIKPGQRCKVWVFFLLARTKTGEDVGENKKNPSVLPAMRFTKLPLRLRAAEIVHNRQIQGS